MISILDVADSVIHQWFIVYRDRPGYFWFTHLQKRGFRHVEAWREFRYGPQVNDVMWIIVNPQFEMLDVVIDANPIPPWIRDPRCTVQNVTAARKCKRVRDWCQLGPASCVEYVKALLGIGIDALFVRTPWQLYKYIAKRNCSIISR